MARRFFMLIFGLVVCAQLSAQVPAQAVGQKVPLTDALKKLEAEFKVRFAYERALVRGLEVAYPAAGFSGKTVEEALHAVLAPLALDFVAISTNYFTVVKKKDREKPAGQAAVQPDPVAGDTLPGYAAPAIPVSRNLAGTIQGHVTNKVTQEPVEFAMVSLPALGLFVATDERGRYALQGIPAGVWLVRVQHVNMVMKELEANIAAAGVYDLPVSLDENVLELKEVEVVARESRAGSATSSIISRSAIEHLQATSLSDVMQLLPGALASNPNFSTVNKASLRQITPDNVGSLGTAVVVNGVPVSNNANLQVANTAAGGANASFATTTGSGVDLRQFTADNIESVEVIRGVPSVEYGDLTSGAIVVKTRSGKYPTQVKARINPTLTQVWAGKGFGLGKQGESLNLDIEYTRTFGDQRYEYIGYNRVTINTQYARQLFVSRPLYTSTGFTYGMNLDEQKRDPDNTQLYTQRKAQDYGFRFNTSGRWLVKRKLARTVNYTAAVNYAVQKGFQQSLVSGATFPIINAMKDTTQVSQYSPSEYLGKLWIEGRPLNIFTKLTDSFFGKLGVFNYRVLVGAEWKMDANYGAGKTYDINLPPQTADGGIAARPRAYSDIPALHQLSLYAEENLFTKIAGRTFTLQAGLRMDRVSVVGTAWSPRVNVAYDLSSRLSVRAGYGIAVKAPTLLYLYPQDAYFDMKNLDWRAENPAERLLIATTKVYNTQNADLRMPRNRKKEVGFDWELAAGRALRVTAYHEEIADGYSFNTTLSSVKITPLQQYVGTANPGQLPTVAEGDLVQVVTDYLMPVNDRRNVNQGIELDFNLGRFDALRTSFVLNGAWMNSRSTSTQHYITRLGGVSFTGPDRVAVFAPGRGTENERMSTALRVIHNIPETRFVVTLLAQTVWVSRNKYLGYEKVPVGYIARSTGNVHWFTAEERSQVTPADNDLYLSIAPEYYVTESWSPSWLFNLRLTKEIGRNIGFSFFTNNVFMSRPLQESNRWKGSFSYRNESIFFGTEVDIKL